MSKDTFPSSHQRVMSHGLGTANCESTTQSQQRHFDAEGSTVNDGWITSAVQTFGLSVEPFGTRHPQVGSTVLAFLGRDTLRVESLRSFLDRSGKILIWERPKRLCSQGGERWRHNQRMLPFKLQLIETRLVNLTDVFVWSTECGQFSESKTMAIRSY